MKFISTRNKTISVSGPEAIVKGLSDEGGLFVPASFPKIGEPEFERLFAMDYAERAAYLIGLFLPELASGLEDACREAYGRFEDGDPAPLVKVDDGLFLLELWHGPTHAFKDIALTCLPHLLKDSKRVTGESPHTLILVATSGDTGKAALEGFKDAPGISVMVFYPVDGVSALQKLQMQTTTGSNVKAVAIKGNFDDAQTAVKEIFTDSGFAKEAEQSGIKLSSANSINFGRLVPQIVYYFSAYADMVNGGQIAYGDKINFCVPTGNFGNILAGYYALRMGLPVGKLICASNRNNVLTDFIGSGTYNAKREFYKTSSPSMDILISSNLERLVFELSGRDDKLTASRMCALKESGTYEIGAKELAELTELFWAGYADEESVQDSLCENFEEYGYIADPHTAVALCVSAEYAAEHPGDSAPTVVLSTASPYKFPQSVLEALGEQTGGSEMKNLCLLEDITALPIPDSLKNLMSMEVLHKDVIQKTDAKQAVISYMKSIKSGKQ